MVEDILIFFFALLMLIAVILLSPMILLIQLGFVDINPNSPPSDAIFTQDVEDFNTPEYPLDELACYAYGIPENAKIESFYYCVEHFWYDSFLEMKFETAEEIDEYIGHIKSLAYEMYKDDENAQNHGIIYEETNPYNLDFIDLFVPDFPTVGYRVKKNEELYIGSRLTGKVAYDIFYELSLFSYSYENLTVCIFSSSIDFGDGITVHMSRTKSYMVPRYFIYFEVEITDDMERMVALR